MSDLKHSISIAGENSLILYFGDRPSDAIASQVAQVVDQLRLSIGEVLIDLVPSYASLLVIYNPVISDHHLVRGAMRAALDSLTVSNAQQRGSLVILPVYYSVESGPDLQGLADGAGLSVDEVVAIHQQTEYRVYAIGFAPGFAYLGEVDERIATSRLATPRQKVPRGSVAIADRQTAVYPAQSPGGWNLIGLCPQRMFDPNLTPSMPVQVGDRVRFDAIDQQAFLALGGEL
ncbi:MAG: 5-oxoprolinase subunit PxpB [Porticoccaceae bacterium]|mgnify:FL=1|jgi:KipI family sensor histidine kinase inhibitor|tara:strand:- start:3363 stop:4058 length:696 start_codon:yes stop_codon:yes gene_type:complete